MQKYIWLVPLLPLIGAAINGLLGRKLRFSERLIGGIAVGSVALSFLISLTAVFSYGAGDHSKPYLTSQDGFSFNWIPGGAVSINQGRDERYAVESEKQTEEQLAQLTRGGEGRIYSDRSCANISTNVRKSILSQCNKYHKCLNFPLFGGGEEMQPNPVNVSFP